MDMEFAPQSILDRVSHGQHLSRPEMAAVIGSIMQGEWAEAQIAALLTALRLKGETVEEIAGAATAMRRHMTPIRSSHPLLVDTCGTGGDASGTFNISTAAALVTAGAGVPVAKHGNRAITSKTGSADVLAALGVNIEAPVAVVERCLEEVGIGFCFAPQLHPSMKHVAAVRRQLGVPTIFNLLGPLCNPASAPFQVLGAGNDLLRDRLSAALALLETQRAVVVTGADGLDEVTLSTVTRVTEIRGGERFERTWEPADFGFQSQELTALRVSGPSESAAVIRGILAGERGPARDIVLLNAAAALWVAGVAADLTECAARAAQAIDSGSALRVLQRLVEIGAK
jgi:anthranilate phosphoribosyltransferase